MLAPVTVHISAATCHLPRSGSIGLRRLGAASTYQVALESALSMTPLLVLENGRALADNCLFADGSSKQVRGVRLAHRSRRQKVAGRRENSGATVLAFLASSQNVGSSSHSNMARAFHYVNSHPRGDPVSSLLND